MSEKVRENWLCRRDLVGIEHFYLLRESKTRNKNIPQGRVHFLFCIKILSVGNKDPVGGQVVGRVMERRFYFVSFLGGM